MLARASESDYGRPRFVVNVVHGSYASGDEELDDILPPTV